MAEPPAKPKARFQFELRHLIWGTVLLAASLGLFGVWGIVAAVLVLWFWWDTFSRMREHELNASKARAVSQNDLSDRPAFTAVELLVVFVMFTVFIALVIALRGGTGQTPPWSGCYGNLTRVSYALRQYHETHGSMPPTYVADDAGRPAHSWRVLILPELGRQDLYDQYRFDEPWDSPHNRKLLDEMPREYQCRDRGIFLQGSPPPEPGMTTYLAVTGKHSAWSAATPLAPKELADPPDLAALIVEAEFQPVPWTKPEDFSVEDVSRLVDPPDSVNQGHWGRKFLWSTYRGRQAIWADYDVHFMPPCETGQLEEMLTVDDGKPDDEAAYLAAEPPATWRQFHYTNIARLVLFLGAAAWPIGWMVGERR